MSRKQFRAQSGLKTLDNMFIRHALRRSLIQNLWWVGAATDSLRRSDDEARGCRDREHFSEFPHENSLRFVDRLSGNNGTQHMSLEKLLGNDSGDVAVEHHKICVHPGDHQALLPLAEFRKS
jgi:hypothetical protein